MTLNDKITTDMTIAMKAQDARLLSTLRMLKSSLKNQQIALGHELSDAEVVGTLEKQAKQRRDSIDQYKAGGREDLAKIEADELLVIEKYLPAKMDLIALGKLVDNAISETGATTMAEMGKVIKLVMERAAGTADGKQVSEIVKAKLS
jgi:uncharacterized protein YqeY